MALKHSNPSRARIDRRGNAYWAYAPYNFVPLPEKMVPARPPLDQDLYHDKNPGLTGFIECELETSSPTYIRGLMTEELFEELDQDAETLTPAQKEKLAPFYATTTDKVDGYLKPAIPGSTIRGMIRTLVEIVGYGRMRWVTNEPPFTYRAVAASRDDPLRDPYREVIGAFGANVRAGYLEKEGDYWYVHPAKTPTDLEWPAKEAFLKVRESQIRGKDISGLLRLNSPDYRPQWYEVSFDAESRTGKLGSYTAVTHIGDRSAGYKHKGTLVCSGNMLETEKDKDSHKRNESPRRKHTLLLPAIDDPKQRLEIPPHVVQAYRASLTTFQDEQLTDWGGKDWGCLKHGAPVFFVAKGNKVLYFGHSPNFRIPAQLFGSNRAATPQDFVPQSVMNDPRPDLADAIFGWVEEKADGKTSGPEGQRAGRVFFSDAQFKDSKDGVWWRPVPITPHTLSGPKPTTFQHYLAQDKKAKHDPDDKSNLAHYGTSPQETRARGHKWYWHKGAEPDIEASDKERKHEKQLTRIMPVKPGVRFSFTIRFENLREEELGAMLWALNLPGEAGKEYRHKIGMGKPLGMGAVALTSKLFLTDRVLRYTKLFAGKGWEKAAQPSGASNYISAFEKYVLNETGLAFNHKLLSEVERIKNLLALLSWPGPETDLTRYMEIEHERLGNEYKERPVLPDAISIANGEAYQGRQPIPENMPKELTRKLPSGYQEGVVKVYGLGPYKDYGFIQPQKGGKDLYVRKSSLAQGVGTLHVGDRVRFTVVQGPKGLQAQDVQLIK